MIEGVMIVFSVLNGCHGPGRFEGVYEEYGFFSVRQVGKAHDSPGVTVFRIAVFKGERIGISVGGCVTVGFGCYTG